MNKYGTIDSLAKEVSIDAETHSEEMQERVTRSKRNKRHCFICDIKRTTDDNWYCEGGSWPMFRGQCFTASY